MLYLWKAQTVFIGFPQILTINYNTFALVFNKWHPEKHFTFLPSSFHLHCTSAILCYWEEKDFFYKRGNHGNKEMAIRSPRLALGSSFSHLMSFVHVIKEQNVSTWKDIPNYVYNNTYKCHHEMDIAWITVI